MSQPRQPEKWAIDALREVFPGQLTKENAMRKAALLLERAIKRSGCCPNCKAKDVDISLAQDAAAHAQSVLNQVVEALGGKSNAVGAPERFAAELMKRLKNRPMGLRAGADVARIPPDES
jgi:hypothetical protein